MRKPPFVLLLEERPVFAEEPEDDDLGSLALGWVFGGGAVVGSVEDFGSSPGNPALREGPLGTDF